jgi:hypothetical protein
VAGLVTLAEHTQHPANYQLLLQEQSPCRLAGATQSSKLMSHLHLDESVYTCRLSDVQKFAQSCD